MDRCGGKTADSGRLNQLLLEAFAGEGLSAAATDFRG